VLSGQGLPEPAILRQTCTIPGTPGYSAAQVWPCWAGVIFTEPWQPSQASVTAKAGWYVFFRFVMR